MPKDPKPTEPSDAKKDRDWPDSEVSDLLKKAAGSDEKDKR